MSGKREKTAPEPKIPLDPGGQKPIIRETGSGSVVCKGGRSNPSPMLLEWRILLLLQPDAGEEVIMTGKTKVFGSQDFFALDIPVT